MATKKDNLRNTSHRKMSPQELSVLKRYGVIGETDNKKRIRATTINELYEQRYNIRNR